MSDNYLSKHFLLREIVIYIRVKIPCNLSKMVFVICTKIYIFDIRFDYCKQIHRSKTRNLIPIAISPPHIRSVEIALLQKIQILITPNKYFSLRISNDKDYSLSYFYQTIQWNHQMVKSQYLVLYYRNVYVLSTVKSILILIQNTNARA